MAVAGAPALQSSYAPPDGGAAGGAPGSNALPQAPGPGPFDPAQFSGINFTPGPAAAPTTPGPAPFAPPPSFMTPALQQYVNQFRQSQAQQQQAMNAGLVQALQGLGERRDAAAKVSAQLPAQYEQQYAAATADQKAAAAAGANAQGPAATANTNSEEAKNNALITAANTQERAAGVSNQPLLQAGITADYSKGATTLANTNMANQAAVEQQQSQFDQQMAMAQAQYQQSVAAQQAGFAHDESMARLNSSLGQQTYKAENPNASLTPAQTVALQNQQAMDQKAINAGFTSYAQAQQVMSSPAYSYAVSVLNGQHIVSGQTPLGNITPGQLKSGNAQDMIRYLQQNNPNILKALVYNGVISMPGVSATGSVTQSQVLG